MSGKENHPIFDIKFDPAVKDFRIIKDDGENSGFEIAGLKFSTYHDQDCCENVYADFSILDHYLEQLSQPIDRLEIKKVDEIGIVLFFYLSESWRPERIGILVTCHNEQNGYYSDELTLVIKEGGKDNIEIDISEATFDNID